MLSVNNFIVQLQRVKLREDAFNPWHDYDGQYDKDRAAPQIRSLQLARYLQERIGVAKYILVAEGLSYQGGKFTGIAMTSERIILAHHEVVPSDAVFGIQAQRTSCMGISASVDKLGMAEPTASIVWKALLKNTVPPREVVLWNIFPWHPFKAGNMLSNRTPDEQELALGLGYFQRLLSLFPNCQILCLGRKSETTILNGLPKLKITALRHPANGGAKLFEDGLVNFLNTNSGI